MKRAVRVLCEDRFLQRGHLWVIALWLALSSGLGTDAFASNVPPESPLKTAGSPRESLSHYLEFCRAGAHAEAARFLTLTPEDNERGPRLARRLKAVLDRHLWFDLSRISGKPDGVLDDGLSADLEGLGEVPVTGGAAEPVRLVRTADPSGPRWLFSADTVARIDAWYEALPGGWLIDHLPEPLLRPGPWEFLWWQWLAVAALIVIAVLAGRVLAWGTRVVLGRVLRRTSASWDDVLLVRLGTPVALLWSTGVAAALLPLLSLYAPAEETANAALQALTTLGVFWALWRAVGVGAEAVLATRAERLSSPARTLVSMGARVAKAALIVAGVLAAMQALGIAVTGVLAGLGIGGLALALAAQKSVENLFGGVALAVDSPFGVGDFVRVEDFVGTVEAIGLRTTRFRTLDRTVITIPNGRLADMRLESFSARDRMRLACTVGLTYGTTAAQMAAVVQGLEDTLRKHPKSWQDAVVVRLKELGASSLDIEVMAWFVTSDWSEFQLIRQTLLLEFMSVVEQAGASFAFPTQTLHLVRE